MIFLKTFTVPSGLEDILVVATPLAALAGVVMTVWVLGNSKRLYSHFVIAVIVLGAAAVAGLVVLTSDYIIRYEGQLFDQAVQAGMEGGDVAIVTLPIVRDESLSDYYPDGLLYKRTQGLKAQQIFEEGSSRNAVKVTKALFAIAYVLFISALSALFCLLFHYLWRGVVGIPKETKPERSPGGEDRVEILPEHQPKSLDEDYTTLLRDLSQWFTVKSRERYEKTIPNEYWDGKILQRFMYEVTGRSPEFEAGLESGSDDYGINYSKVHFRGIKSKGFSVKQVPNLFRWTAACSHISLKEALDRFSAYYLENGRRPEAKAYLESFQRNKKL